MNRTHQTNTLQPLVLAFACLAAGASWAQQVTVVVEPVPRVDPVVAARQQEMALQVARANLGQQGIGEPTTAQLALATSDVQAQRDSGMGWGQIANGLGLRLGAVVSAANRADQADRLAAATTTRPAKAGSPTQGGDSGRSNAGGGGQGAGSSGNQGGGASGGSGNAGGGSGNGGHGGKGGNSGHGGSGGNGGGKGGGNGGGKR